MNTFGYGDEFIKDMAEQFWRQYRAQIELIIDQSKFPEEYKAELRASLEAVGQAGLDEVRGLLNDLGVLFDREAARTSLLGNLTKASIHALRAMKADGFADDLQERLTQILNLPVASRAVRHERG